MSSFKERNSYLVEAIKIFVDHAKTFFLSIVDKEKRQKIWTAQSVCFVVSGLAVISIFMKYVVPSFEKIPVKLQVAILCIAWFSVYHYEKKHRRV